MSIFKTAYDTTVGSGFVTNKIEHAIKESIIKDAIQYIDGSFEGTDLLKPMFIANTGLSEANIPYFSHPLIVEDLSKQKYICVDVRAFVKQNQQGMVNSFNIKNETEFNLAKSRLALNLIWLTQNPESLRDLSILPCAIFSSWISESVSNRFALDPKDQLVLAIISSYYYQSLFSNFDTFNEETRQKIATVVIRATKAPAKLVFETIDKIEKISNLEEFCSTCRSILENTRIDNLNTGLLITILGNSWFGMSAKEILAVSLEHPPTWISLVYAGLTEKTFKKSMISRISERYTGNKGGNDFIRAFVSLVQSVSKNENSDYHDSF